MLITVLKLTFRIYENTPLCDVDSVHANRDTLWLWLDFIPFLSAVCVL